MSRRSASRSGVAAGTPPDDPPRRAEKRSQPRGARARACSRLLGATAWVACAAALAAADSAPAVSPAGPIVELPKFEVTDSRLLPPPEKWHYAEIPGFEILSNASARETKRFVADFLLLQEALNILMPGLRSHPVAVPTSLIVTGRRNAFDQFVVDGEERLRRNTLFYNEPERSVIVVDFQLAEVKLEDNTTVETDAYRSFYKEYFRHIIHRNTANKAPAWFEEGLVQIFAGIDFNRKWITFAVLGDGFGGEKVGDFNRLLHQRALLPLGELFEDPPRLRGIFWSAQSYALVHMCLYGRNLKYQRPFIQFVRRLERESASEALFKECFNKSYKEMGMELRAYIDFTDYKAVQFTAKKGQALPAPPPFALKDAPDAVVGRLKGEALRLAGRGGDAHNTLIAPYVRGERDPRLLAAIGLDEARAGKDERALKFLEAAANAKVDRARAHLELARLRLKNAKAKPGAGRELLSPEQVAGVLMPLFTARKLPPPMPEVYALIAETWTISAVPPEMEHFAVVVEGVKAFPRNAPLVLQAALLAMKRGFPEEARALADLGERASADPADRDRFRTLAAAMERDAAPSAQPGSEPKPRPAGAYLLERAP